MSAASTVSRSAASAVRSSRGEVGQVLAHARLERGGLGAHGLGGGLQHLLARGEALLGARDPLLELGDGQLERAAVDGQALADEGRQPGGVGERVIEQQLAPLVGDGGPQRLDERVEPGARAIAGERALGRDREERGLGDDGGEVLAREGERLGQLLVVEQIGLRDHEQQPIAVRAQDALLEELALGRGQDLRRVEQEDRGVGARQVAVGDLGALLVDVVDARRVDDREVVLEQRRRVGDLDVVDGVAVLLSPSWRLPWPPFLGRLPWRCLPPPPSASRRARPPRSCVARPTRSPRSRSCARRGRGG